MLVGIPIFSLLLIVANCQFNEFFKDRIRKNPEAKPPKWLPIRQPLDHFDPLNEEVFVTRSLYNDQFFKDGGPIITHIGGEWEIEDYGVMGGVAFQLAKKHRGFLFYPEHRYFGRSIPENYTQPFTVEQLKYLTVEQTLGDLVNSHQHLKENIEGLKNSQVVLIGGSYAGALAVWARVKYPDTFSMSYACGGVTKADLINDAYYDVVFQSYRKQGEYCSSFLKDGFSAAKKQLESKHGRAKLYSYLKNWYCYNETNLNTKSVLQRMLLTINSQLWFSNEWRDLCDYVKNNRNGSLIERFADVISRTSTNKKKFGRCTEDTENGNTNYITQQWYWLVCTGLANFQVTTAENFGSYIATKEDLIKEWCVKRFGSKFNYEHVRKMNKRHTTMFGGKTPDATKILMVQGTHDPWRPNAMTDDVNDHTSVVYIEGASHCSEIGETQENDPARIIQAKLVILDVLSGWLN